MYQLLTTEETFQRVFKAPQMCKEQRIKGKPWGKASTRHADMKCCR